MYEAKEKVTPQEFMDWLSYWEVEPALRDHVNVIGANICKTIYDVNRSKRDKVREIKDFLIEYSKERPVESKEHRLNKLMFFFGSHAKKGK